VLVTSRERLHVQGEQVYPVPTLNDSDGIELFVTRARALDPGYVATGPVERLCARLDNLPLALELAAARTTVFSSAQLLERLSQRFELLKGTHDSDPRQQTLQATIAWSYDLLTPEERRLFQRLSVFPGGCAYDTAEELCDADVDALQSLLDKSLLRRRTTTSEPRYWMLETIREYSAGRLDESSEAPTLRRRHAYWCCTLAEKLTGRITGLRGHAREYTGADEEAIARLQDETDNIQAALDWAWANDENELGLRLGTACVRLWLERDLFADAVRWLDAASPQIERASPPVQLQALKVAGLVSFFVKTDTETADLYWARAHTIADELGDTDEIAWLDGMRGGSAWERGDLEVARHLHEANLAHTRLSGDRHREADLLHHLGEVLRDLRRFDEAEAALREAETIFRELNIGTFLISANTHSLADLALDRGDLDAAEHLYRQSLDQYGRSSLSHAVVCLAGIASVHAERGDDEAAATLWGTVCAAEKQLGFQMLAAERRRYENRLNHLEDTSAWHHGTQVPVEAALASLESL
jgi:tetratricopeptide (TPR) repeat protein